MRWQGEGPYVQQRWVTPKAKISSSQPKVIFLAVAEVKGEGGKTLALEVAAEGEAEGLVFCI